MIIDIVITIFLQTGICINGASDITTNRFLFFLCGLFLSPGNGKWPSLQNPLQDGNYQRATRVVNISVPFVYLHFL